MMTDNKKCGNEWTRFSSREPEKGQFIVIRDVKGLEFLYKVMATNMGVRKLVKCVEWRQAGEEDFMRIEGYFLQQLSCREQSN